MMSERELAKSLIDRIPEGRLYYVIAYLQGAAVPEEIPNAETIAAFRAIENGEGETFDGSTEDFIKKMLEDEPCSE